MSLTCHRYEHLDASGAQVKKAQTETRDFDETLLVKINSFLLGDKDFIYKNDIAKVWDDYVAK